MDSNKEWGRYFGRGFKGIGSDYIGKVFGDFTVKGRYEISFCAKGLGCNDNDSLVPRVQYECMCRCGVLMCFYENMLSEDLECTHGSSRDTGIKPKKRLKKKNGRAMAIVRKIISVDYMKRGQLLMNNQGIYFLIFMYRLSRWSGDSLSVIISNSGIYPRYLIDLRQNPFRNISSALYLNVLKAYPKYSYRFEEMEYFYNIYKKEGYNFRNMLSEMNMYPEGRQKFLEEKYKWLDVDY
jgi:hypothetical protein